jgi:hypothetical protein
MQDGNEFEVFADMVMSGAFKMEEPESKLPPEVA